MSKITVLVETPGSAMPEVWKARGMMLPRPSDEKCGDAIRLIVAQRIGNLISPIVLFGGNLVMMFITNWIMVLTAIVATRFAFVFMMAIMSKSQKYFARQQRALNGHVEEMWQNRVGKLLCIK